MRKNMFKRMLALTMAMIMVLGMIPELHLHAHAEGEEEITAPQSEDWCGNPLCSQEDNAHVTSCVQYAAPENPVCHCAEKCTEANVWCDVCGFDYTQCGGEDTATAYDTITSGTCGDNLTWTYDAGTLTISGSGDMADYEVDSFGLNNTPWSAYITSITDISLPEGLTSIGTYAFYGCNSLKELVIPGNVKTVGNGSIAPKTNITVHYLGTEGSVTLGDSAVCNPSLFHYCAEKEGIEATCVATGHEAGWYCASCQKYITGAETAIAPDNHNMVNGVCTDCEYECTHETYEDGQCTACGEDCAHTGGTATTYTDKGDGTHSFACSICGATVTENHSFTDGTCTACGVNWFSVSGNTLTIDGTLGGKTTATEDDVNALVDQLKAYVDSGNTTIIVTGSKPAMIEVSGLTITAIGEAIYRLSKEESYYGKIDLILPDVTEIFDQEFHSARALNSITLPKVTKLADQAFYGTLYLRTITFGSVITEVNELGAIFNQVGYNVGGCDLILNCGQMNETNVPTPDLTTNTWKFKFENEFKSITLTHTEGTAATCIAQAVCSVCGESYGDIDADAHSYGDWVSNGNNTHTRTCANDSTHTENGNCSGGTATCKEQAVCDICKTAYGELGGHSPNAAGYTVNADGTHSYTCSSCGNPFTESHTFTDGACTGCGVIGGYCGEEGNEQNVIWTYANGTLTISGTGAMADQFDNYNNRPWEEYVDQITTIVVNDGITSIGEAAFWRFQKLTTAKLPDSLTTISQQAFYGCTALKTVNFPANLKTIEGWAFLGCALESVTLPEGLTTIGYRAFSECKNLTSVTVPASVTTIDEGAFGYSPAKITVAEDNPNYSSDEHGVLFDKDKTTLIYCRPNIEVETYTIPSTVTEICKEAFYGCKNLATITIPDGVQKIGSSAFGGCEALTTITIPAGVTTIEANTFYDCTALTAVTIPAGVTTIDMWAFSGCTALTTVTIPASVTSIAYNAFSNCSALTTVNVPCTWDGSLYTFDEGVTVNKVHNWVGGACTVCGVSCDHTDSTHTAVTDKGDGTHSFECSVCGETGSEAHNYKTGTSAGACACGAACPHSNFDSATGNCKDCEISLAIAKIKTGETTIYYQTADDLRTAVLESGDDQTITLLADFEMNNDLYFNADGTENILDLNEYTLTGSSRIDVASGELTITGPGSINIFMTADNEGAKIVVGSGVTLNDTLRSAYGGVLDLTNATIPEAGLNVILYSDDSDPTTYNVSDVLLLPADYYFFVDGKAVYTYSGETEGTVLKHTEHSYTYTDNGDGTHDKACTACGKVEVDNEAHTPDADSYRDLGDGTHSFTCASCGTVIENHSYVNGMCVCKKAETYSITCTETGSNGGQPRLSNTEPATYRQDYTTRLLLPWDLLIRAWYTDVTGVSVNGDTLVKGLDYTFNPNNVTLTINGDKVTGNIEIEYRINSAVTFELNGGELESNLEAQLAAGGLTVTDGKITMPLAYGVPSSFGNTAEALNQIFLREGYTCTGLKNGDKDADLSAPVENCTLTVQWQCLHTIGGVKFSNNGNGTHNGYCGECGELLGNYVERPHVYDETTHQCVCGQFESFTVHWAGAKYLELITGTSTFGQDFVQTIPVPENTHLRILEVNNKEDGTQVKYSFENDTLTIEAEDLPTADIDILCEHYVEVKFDANGGKIIPEEGFPKPGDTGFAEDGSYWVQEIYVGGNTYLSHYVNITYTGYTLIDWRDATGQIYPMSEANGAEYVSATEDVTVYAQWQANQYTVTWNVDGSTSTTTQTYDAALALPAAPEKEDCGFLGWFTAEEGGEQVTAETIFQNANNNTVYYARFCDHKDASDEEYIGTLENPTPTADGTQHIAIWSCCGAEAIVEHTMVPSTGKCICGVDMAAAGTTVSGTTTYYQTLAEAIAAAAVGTKDAPAAVTVLKNIDITETIQVSSGVFTLNLNGMTLRDYEGDGLINGIFSLPSGSTAHITIADAAGGKLLADWRVVEVHGGTVTITGGEFSGEGLNLGDSVTIYGGTLSISGGSLDGVTADKAGLDETIVNISGGSIGHLNVHPNADSISLSGGEFLTISCREKNASELLADGYSYWNQEGTIMLIPEYDTDLDDVIVKATCLHPEEKLSYKDLGTGTHNTTCADCGTTFAEGHSGGKASCIAKAVCDFCGASYGTILDHNYTYAADEDANTITESCDKGCNHSKTLTLKAPENLVFDGNAHEATVEGSIYAEYDLTYSANPVSAGDYIATLSVGSTSVSLEYTIEKADSAYTAPTPNTLTYTGMAHNLISGGEAVGGTMVYSLAEDGEYTLTIPQGTNAGNYRVWYYVQGDENHNDTAAQFIAVDIGKADAPIIAFPEVLNSITYGQKLEDAKLSFYENEYGTFNWSAPTGVPNAGSAGYALDFYPEDLNNYDWASCSWQSHGASWISSRNALCAMGQVQVDTADAATETAPTAKQLTYNGQAQSLITAGSTNDGKMVYSLTENGQYSETIPTGTDAGDYTIWYYVVGDSNHTDSAKASVDVSIAQKKLAVSISGSAVKVYDETAAVPSGHTLSITLDGVYAEDEISASASFVFAGSDLGTTTVNASNISISGADIGNYYLAASSVSADVGAITGSPLSDFVHSFDNENATVTLTKYIGTSTFPVVPKSYTVDGTTYNVVLDSASVFNGNTSILKLKIEGGVAFVGNVMSYLFANCKNLTSIDVRGLDTGNITSMRETFSYCEDLVSLRGYENWNTGSLLDMYKMFNRVFYVSNNAGTMENAVIDLSKWDLDQVKNTGWCFQLCYANEILLPDNLAVISAGFMNHATKVTGSSYTIPAGVKKIGYAHTIYDFATNDFVEFKVAEGNTAYKVIGGILYSMDGTEMLAIPRNTPFANGVYAVPEGVTFMGELSFSRNYNITKLILPDSYIIEQNVDVYDPDYIVYEDKGNLNNGNSLSIAIYCYTGISEYEVKKSNLNYSSVDGIIYSKDMTQLVAIPTRYAQLIDIPEGVTTWNEQAMWDDQQVSDINSLSNVVDGLIVKCGGINIPSSLVSVDEDQRAMMNRLVDKYGKDSFVISVDEANPRYYVDKDGKLMLRADISDANVSLNQSVFVYGNDDKKPVPTVLIGNSTLTEGRDYKLSYEDNRNAGTGKLIITGIGIYTGTKEISFTIQPKPITDADVKLSESLTYNGKEQTQQVIVTEGITYELSGNKATDAGSYTLTVKAKGNYSGNIEKTWKIEKAEQTIRLIEPDDMVCGESYDLTIEAIGQLTYLSNNPGVISVDENGSLTALKAGSATITATASETENYLKAEISFTVTAAHSHDREITRPTCEDKGYTTYICICGDSYVTDYVDAIGHDYDDGVITTKPGCESEGVKTFTCANDGSHTYTEPVPAIGHDYDDGVVTTKPGCESEGVKTFTCANDGSHTYTEPVPATGHAPKAAVEENRVEAGCEQPGSYEIVVYCGTCGKELSSTQHTIPAIGHDYDDGVITTKPGCESEGVKTFTCANDSSHTYTESVPATGHAPKAAVEENRVEAGCEQEGSYEMVVYCGTCGKKLSSTQHTIPAIGHDYDDGVITTKPGCESEGVKTFTCANDSSHTYTEPVPATGHSFGSWTTSKSPNCTTKGQERRDCTSCDHYETRPTAALGHKYSDPMDPSCNVCGAKREVHVASIPMFRLYNPVTGEHHYTGSEEERDMLTTVGWNYEGVAWNAPVEFGAPVYRYFNPINGDHHYTMSAAEGADLLAAGWNYEGVAWNSASSEHLPIYRLYNPNTDIGAHHFTGSAEERDMLVDAGWIYEGIGWFALLY